MAMNLPNALTVARIVAAPVVAALPFSESWELRLFAFVLFLVVAITDYYDGKLARTHGMVTDLGKLLDPIADKLLLLATFVPMFILVGSRHSLSLWSPNPVSIYDGAILGVGPAAPGVHDAFPYVTPFGVFGLPWWIIAVVLGREAFMTIYRLLRASKGEIISASRMGKWKTGFQWTWVGATFFWFAAATAAVQYHWSGAWWLGFAYFNGTVNIVSMIVAVILTLYSQLLYLRRPSE
ncbi:MAG: CDP-alcohol phosphatidyltransferase family protein [Gemmatimonadaceae bacterium]|nr:CDP-alcohol phosphatidyltransferase family protein [Gemmatimonadaceae bacterium]